MRVKVLFIAVIFLLVTSCKMVNKNVEDESTKFSSTTTSTSETKVTTSLTSTTKSKEVSKDQEIVIELEESKDSGYHLPMINSSLVENDAIADFNDEMKKIYEKLLEKENSSGKKGYSDYIFSQNNDIVSLMVFYYFGGENEENKSIKTIIFDKSEAIVFTAEELLEKLGYSKEMLVNQYVEYTKGYLLHDKAILNDYEVFDNVSEYAFEYISEAIENNELPMFYDGEELSFHVIKFTPGDENAESYFDFRVGVDYIAVARKNSEGAFSKVDIADMSYFENVEKIELPGESKNRENMLLKFNELGKVRIITYENLNLSESVPKKVEFEKDVNKGDELVISVDMANKRNLYKIVLDAYDDVYYTMDINPANPVYECEIETTHTPDFDYRNEIIEEKNSDIMSGEDLIGSPLQKISEIYGYEYKLKPVNNQYELVFDDRSYPVLMLDSNLKDAIVNGVFSDVKDYNMIKDIYVGMTIAEVEEKVGSYKAKVSSGDGIYDSYTVFSIDDYDLYVYAKDNDLISFGMRLSFPLE